MNIINFIKKNAMAMVAAVAIIGFSSFNLVENYNSAGLMWYPVDATGNISSTGNSSPTSGCSDQQLPIVCEIQLESNPTHLLLRHLPLTHSPGSRQSNPVAFLTLS